MRRCSAGVRRCRCAAGMRGGVPRWRLLRGRRRFLGDRLCHVWRRRFGRKRRRSGRLDRRRRGLFRRRWRNGWRNWLGWRRFVAGFGGRGWSGLGARRCDIGGRWLIGRCRREHHRDARFSGRGGRLRAGREQHEHRQDRGMSQNRQRRRKGKAASCVAIQTRCVAHLGRSNGHRVADWTRWLVGPRTHQDNGDAGRERSPSPCGRGSG